MAIVAMSGRDRDHLLIRLLNCLQFVGHAKEGAPPFCHPVILISTLLLQEPNVEAIDTI
jgi:hypothetical protein